MKKSISVKDTQEFAKAMAEKFMENPPSQTGALLVALQGELGSGKTTFARGCARALGIQEPVLSPTFTIIKSYEMPIQESPFRFLYHVDCYRLRDEQELLDLGWEEIVSNPRNIILVEWPERISRALLKQYATLTFLAKEETTREIIS